MEPSQKPVILLIHGAWHSPGHYNLLIAGLRDAGYVVLVPTLTTLGWGDEVLGKSWPDDVALLISILLPYFDQGREVVVVGHSYGGVSATQCCAGHTVPERAARGDKGGIKAVVFLTAWALPNANIPSSAEDSSSLSTIDHETGILTLTSDAARQFYAADLAQLFPPEANGDGINRDKANATRSIKLAATSEALRGVLGQHSLIAPANKQLTSISAADIAVPKTYIVCTLDEAINPELQRGMARSCGASIVEIDAGHSPFIVPRHVEKIVEVITAAPQVAK
ncbi:alpha/beta fold hydrolase [Microdochium nivale]|nr:alpha/beta fold hydrolase [Microdochium nivale]